MEDIWHGTKISLTSAIPVRNLIIAVEKVLQNDLEIEDRKKQNFSSESDKVVQKVICVTVNYIYFPPFFL